MDLKKTSENNTSVDNLFLTGTNDDLNELRLHEEINVWSRNEEALKNEALEQLEIFAYERKQELEKYESIAETNNESTAQSLKKDLYTRDTILDINSLIKKQEELQKCKTREIAILNSKNNLPATYCPINKPLALQKKPKKKKRTRDKVVLQSSTEKSKQFTVVSDTNKGDNTEEIAKTDLSPDLSHTVLFRTTKQHINYKELNDINIEDGGEIGDDRLRLHCEQELDNSKVDTDIESEYIPSDNDVTGEMEESDNDPEYTITVKIASCSKTVKSKRRNSSHSATAKIFDDSILKNYKARLDVYYSNLEAERALECIDQDDNDDVNLEKYHLLKGGLKVPTDLWDKLYSFQQEGIEWLWKLHQKPTGGLLGDEMGLGKTVQIIVFLHALQYSNIISSHCRFNGLGPSLIVCPATLIHQWVKHFHEWSPEFRIAVLHQSGTFHGNQADLIKEIHKSRGIIITSYHGIVKYKGNLLDHNWHYLIVDEGHKIRNSTAKITIAIKQIRTPHRIMLTGSPMQNNLTELWSLFDFTNPGMLGNLTTFQEHFANPILYGGFANASPMQEATALSVASTLKNVISPYLLRRSKAEVQSHILLPNKSEQVLFCSLTDEQKYLYKSYLLSEHVNMILGRGIKTWHSKNYLKANVLMAITVLRKICNHPDLYSKSDEPVSLEDNTENPHQKFGYYKKSGKMIVVSALLKIWKKQGHRVLLFSQGRGMIHVFQDFLEKEGYKYLKMDGSTTVTSRQGLIDTFNMDDSYDVFLLTTRVGGLGVNLTGANRVIIYDPDWNPATDTQARERSWRIGQEKQVTVYRLLSAGTIEEKIYQRQVWKQLLSNKILVDPSTHRFFKSSDLYDLFSLEENDSNLETANIFHDSRVKIQEKCKQTESLRKKKRKLTNDSESEAPIESHFTQEKIDAMKDLAQKISQSLSQKKHESGQKEVKTFYQKEIEEERRLKLQEKEKLKSLTAPELVELNRKKAMQKKEDESNKVDDYKTNSFDKALEYAERTAKWYHKLDCGKVHVSKRKRLSSANDTIDVKRQKIDNKETTSNISGCEKKTENEPMQEQVRHKSHKRHKHKSKNKKHKSRDKRDRTNSVVDISGKVDGEKVEGLVKCEIKKAKKEKEDMFKCESQQNNFVLKHLFSKSGVAGALEHESIVGTGAKTQSLKVRTEAEVRAHKALEALKTSRLNNWRW